jgi:hypothetical protein
MNIRLSQREFERLAEQTVIHRSAWRNRRFRSFFGCSSRVATALWNRARKKKLLPVDFAPKHMLWTLAFMKLYDSEEVLAAICRCDAKTFRKWVWKGVDILGDLDLVRPVIVPFVTDLQQSIHLSTFLSSHPR